MNTELRDGAVVYEIHVYAEYHRELKSPEIFLKNYVKEEFLR